MVRLIRFLARNRMLTPSYARLALRYARRRLFTSAGWRWQTDGPLFLGRGLQIQIGKRGRLRFGRFVWIGDGTKIRCHEGEVIIGDKTVLGQECTISAYRHVRIGEQCVIADRAMFIDFDHGIVEVERTIREQGIYKRDVNVGSNVWIGYGACILRGVQVGDNAMIGTNAVVTADVPANAVVGGIPAKVIRMREAPARCAGATRSSPRPARPPTGAAPPTSDALAREPGVEGRGPPGDVEPVEAAQVLVGLGDQATAQLVVGEHPDGDLHQRLGIAGAEAQPGFLVRDDLAQATGVGDDAGTAGGHRLQRHQPEGLVDRGHHANVGDPVERVQHVVADPAEEGPVPHQPKLLGLAPQLLLVGAGAGDQEPGRGSRSISAGIASSASWKPFS